ncbi:cytochrome P450 monooxygenase [Diaporthe amygdali]|uniref:cytochrome P450 monooxygenase n=1 Tax=Phomopsis amygdali TaxID=1214568 RepID=UPI0022FEC571|nr:cytochrome P450 monooxygenase [Diaporthe amygdali]KAJ0119705.1 cytochrome P450 monooxygenase [Diaporthe amygdali]
MADKAIELVAERWPLIVTAILACTITLFVPTLKRKAALWHLPIVGKEKWNYETRRMEFLLRAEKVYEEGYRKFRAGIFRITSDMESETVVVGPKYLPELSKLPESSLSVLDAIDELMSAKYTKVNATAAVITQTLKTRLTPPLGKLSGHLGREVKAVMAAEMPECSDWTDMHVHPHLVRVVARVSGSIIVGTQLSRSNEYIEHAINYALDVINGTQAIRRLNDRVRQAGEFFTPVVATRKEKAKDPAWEKPDDLLQWLIDVQEAQFGQITPQALAKYQLDVAFAAIHTTTAVALSTFYTLAVMPEAQIELREEIRSVLAETGGEYINTSVQNMKKLDSFIRESVRYYPIGAAVFMRKTLKPITLSDGTRLPEGIVVQTSVSAASKDSSLFEEPEKFDYLRFYRQRQNGAAVKGSEAGGKGQMVGVGLDNLVFGFGRHACPGRFFAINEIKMIVAELLMKYDVKNVEGVEERYPNLIHGAFFDPDPSRHLLLKEIAL